MGLGEELSEDCIREGALKMGLLPPKDPLRKWTVDTALMRLVASHRESDLVAGRDFRDDLVNSPFAVRSYEA